MDSASVEWPWEKPQVKKGQNGLAGPGYFTWTAPDDSEYSFPMPVYQYLTKCQSSVKMLLHAGHLEETLAGFLANTTRGKDIAGTMVQGGEWGQMAPLRRSEKDF